MPLFLSLILHAHQPVGNFDHVIEEAYQTSYLPFVEEAERRPWLHFTLHFSGSLLAWIAERHAGYIERLRVLVQQGRLEVLGGGYYEPILVSIPDRDKIEQIQRLSQLLEKLFQTRPRGIWLTERVWEPELPAPLHRAGVDFAIIDDTHFILAGLEPEQTYGYLITEHGGSPLRVVPSNKFLRCTMPFRPEQESLAFLREQAQRHPGALLTMGDDMEKFGTWPHTFQHVYKDGWLRRFFDQLEQEQEVIETTTLAQYLDQHAPLGLVYLPTASYAEMMQWALPAPAAAQFHRALHDPASEPYRRFLSGAPWRSFLAKYGEANLMHKTALDVSARLHQLQPGAGWERDFAAAYDDLMAAQCNDAYWHGLFGGLYAPHLRDTVYTRLIAADRKLDELAGNGRHIRRLDLNLDGVEEVELRTPGARVLVVPADGGTAAAIDDRRHAAALVNSLQRRPEVYHEDIRQKVASNPANLPGTQLHDHENLQKALCYDRYARVCGRLYLMPAEAAWEQFEKNELGENAEAASGSYQVSATEEAAGELRVSLSQGGAAQIQKTYILRDEGRHSVLCCEAETGGLDARRCALEFVLNLLAPDAPDRLIRHGGRQFPLAWKGALQAAGGAEAGELELTDGWRQLRLRLLAPGAQAWWVRPIYTVSQSEGGFEQVYQGSVLLAVWPVGVSRCSVQLRIEPL